MSRRLVLRFSTLLLLLVALLVAGCGGDDEPASGSETPTSTSAEETPASTEPIILGAATAQTGPVSAFDSGAFNGVKLAIADINAEGGVNGRQLELVAKDTKSDVAIAPRVAREVLDEGAEMLIVTADFDFGAPAALVAQGEGKISMSLTSASPKFGDLVSIGNLAYTMGSAVNGTGANAAEFAYEDLGHKSVWVLSDVELVYNTGMASGFIDRMKMYPDGKVLGVETFKESTDQSVASQITKLKGLSEQPDFIFIAACPAPGGALAIRQIRAAGIDLPIVGGDCFDGDYWIEAVPDLSDFHFVAYGSIFGDDSRPEVNELTKKYTDEFGDKPSNSGVLSGYSLVQAYATAVERAGSSDPEAVNAELQKFSDEELLIPTTFTDSSHISVRENAIMKIEGGKYSFVKRRKPQEIPEYSNKSW
jgi:branched-chain amino acid transport system substrate-binding protein